MMKVSIIQKESDNTNSLVPIRSPGAPSESLANPSNFSSNLNNQLNLINNICYLKHAHILFLTKIK